MENNATPVELEPINAPVPLANDKNVKQEIKNVHTGEREVQDAVNETGFGWYNMKIMAISSLTFFNVAISLTSIGLILPAAACDFQMTTIDKGRLCTAPMIGMLLGSYFWGCLTDIKGRKVALLFATALHGVSEFAASLMPSYWAFLCFKFTSGMAMNGQMTIIFAYLGEFQPTKYRDRLMSWMEIAWAIGLMISPAIGWLIIPLDINYKTASFSFRSWNLFVLFCSLPPLIAALCFVYSPETPKYLAETGQDDKLFELLSTMYAVNTRRPKEEYAMKLRNSGNERLLDLASHSDSTRVPRLTDDRSLIRMLMHIFAQTLTVLKWPYLRRTLIMCFVSYSVTASYYALSLWLPELFQRFANFEQRYPNSTASVCTVSLIPFNVTQTVPNDPYGCETPIQTSVYIFTVLLGVACVPTGIILPLFIDRLGYKFFLISTTLIASAITIGLFLVKSSVENLILSCIFESLTSICISVIACMLVELYPTNLRAMAAGLAALSSRMGAIIGNSMFGYLIDDYCTPLIGIVALQLFLSGALGIFVPGRKKLNKLEKLKVSDNAPI